MFPWSFNFNPQVNGWEVHWPLGGPVTQDIVASLLTQAGSSRVELRVLDEVASYGRQIGVLSKLVRELSEERPPRSELTRHAREQLDQFMQRIERIKEQEEDSKAHQVPEDLESARELHRALLRRYPELAAEG
ncbi:MAG TPA: hypothetical protein VFP68_19735 [Burkholderiaceae bacterium]|nr:hypothetical protein [Burkholderiaceae bacterium]